MRRPGLLMKLMLCLSPYTLSLEGGVSDEVTLSAYITAAFLEMNRTVDVSEFFKPLSKGKQKQTSCSS